MRMRSHLLDMAADSFEDNLGNPDTAAVSAALDGEVSGVSPDGTKLA